MRAIVYEQFQGPLSLQTVRDPTPTPDGVVIGVEASGLCRSDWHGWMGHDPGIQLPHVPGHELAGVVQEVGRSPSASAAGPANRAATGTIRFVTTVFSRASPPGARLPSGWRFRTRT
jgi:D-arabinose 1-dehydrogenase-like Zn-dependent alcohol dehydrogenase